MLMTFALLATALFQDAAARDAGVTAVDEIVVVGGRATSLLTVVVDGDADAATLVSAEPDIRCGPNRYRYESFGRPRLCWTRRVRGETLVLTPRSTGAWSVTWTGCGSIDDAGRCSVAVGSTAEVRATFRRNG